MFFLFRLDFCLLRSRRFRVSVGLCSSYAWKGLSDKNVTWLFFHLESTLSFQTCWKVNEYYIHRQMISDIFAYDRVNQCNLLFFFKHLKIVVAASALRKSPNVSEQADSPTVYSFLFYFCSLRNETKRTIHCSPTRDRETDSAAAHRHTGTLKRERTNCPLKVESLVKHILHEIIDYLRKSANNLIKVVQWCLSALLLIWQTFISVNWGNCK